jgi:hypothetical protein
MSNDALDAMKRALTIADWNHDRVVALCRLVVGGGVIVYVNPIAVPRSIVRSQLFDGFVVQIENNMPADDTTHIGMTNAFIRCGDDAVRMSDAEVFENAILILGAAYERAANPPIMKDARR